MFCPNCGTKNEDGAAFCAKCGTSLQEQQIAQPQQGPAMAQPQQSAQPQQAQAMAQPQQSAQPQQAQAMAQPQQAQAPKQPMSPNILKAIIAAGAVFVALIVFIIVGSTLSNPERVVKNFFKAGNACEWDKVYKCIDVPKGEFITKDTLAAINKDVTPQEITNFEIIENDTASTISKEYTVIYYASGNARRTSSIELVKSGKTMLFWNRYKVSAGTLVVKDCTVRVNENMKLYMDDVEVADKYISDTKDGKKIYKFDYLFEGTHKLKVTSDMYEDEEKEATFSYNEDSASISTSKIKESIVKDREAQAENDMKNIYDAAIAGKSFDDLKLNHTTTGSKINELQKRYSTFLSNTKKTDGYGVKKIEFTKTSSTANTGSSEGKSTITVAVTAEVKAIANVKTYKSGTYIGEDKTVNDTLKSTFTYIYEDNQWKLYSYSLDRVAY